MLAGGVAVEAFMSDLFGPELRKTISVLLLVLALVIGGGSFFRWLNVERAMRRKTPLPLPLIAPILTTRPGMATPACNTNAPISPGGAPPWRWSSQQQSSYDGCPTTAGSSAPS